MRKLCYTFASIALASAMTSCGYHLYANRPLFAFFGYTAVAGDCMTQGKRILGLAGYRIADAGTPHLLVAKRAGDLGEWYCFAAHQAAINVASTDPGETKALVGDILRARPPNATPFPLASVSPDDGKGPSDASIAMAGVKADRAVCGTVSVAALRRSGLTTNADATGHFILGRNPFVSADVYCGPHFLAINVMGATKKDTDGELRAIESHYPKR